MTSHTLAPHTLAPQFSSIQALLIWLTETQRAARNPQTANVYQKLKDMNDGLRQAFETPDPQNTHGLDRAHIAADLETLLQATLTEEEYTLQRLYYFGDYATATRLQRAKAFQETCRRDGTRVRLSWRYSYRQIGRLLKLSDKTVAKRLHSVEEKLGRACEAAGYLQGSI